jgi:hypothetical protein
VARLILRVTIGVCVLVVALYATACKTQSGCSEHDVEANVVAEAESYTGLLCDPDGEGGAYRCGEFALVVDVPGSGRLYYATIAPYKNYPNQEYARIACAGCGECGVERVFRAH